jgi:hypothetical protein
LATVGVPGRGNHGDGWWLRRRGDWPKVGVLAPQFVEPDGIRVDVFSECRKYLVLLKELLDACERFTATRPSP